MKNQITAKQKQSCKNIIQTIVLAICILAIICSLFFVLKPVVLNISKSSLKISNSLLDLNKELFNRKNNSYYSADFIKEKENNNDSKKANVIKLNQKYKGSLSSKKDEDWYYFEIPESGKIIIRLHYRYQLLPCSYYSLWLYRKEKLNRAMKAFESGGFYMGMHSNEIEVDEGGYYIKVCANDMYAQSPYLIQIEY